MRRRFEPIRMTSMTVTRRIAAPMDVVFRTVADINRFAQVVPQIVRIELLSDVRSGIGTRFRETRLMNGQEVSTELAVTEYVENNRVRIVSDAGGTVWDTVFTVVPAEGSTELTMVMEARPYELRARITTRLIAGAVRKAVEQDMDAVKAFCERAAEPAAG